MQNLEIKVEFNVAVPMRDGTVLRADVYRPCVDQPVPTLLARTPYDKWNYRAPLLFCDPVRLARNGYAVVTQDCRGCGASDGEFYPFRHDAADGYDSVEWAANQPWSNQRVGMIGGSYLGSMQWMAANERPPHLATILPMMAPLGVRGLMFRGGVFQLQTAQHWSLLMSGMLARRRLPGKELGALMQAILVAMDHPEPERKHLPLNSWPTGRKAACMDFYFDFLAHPANDAYWHALESGSYETPTVPVFVVGGWHDACMEAGELAGYMKMRERSGTAANHVRLMVGPWIHDPMPAQSSGDIDFGILGSAVAIDLNGAYLRWLDYWLKDIDNGVMNEPPVRLFVMGTNIWRNELEWPLARTQYTKYYMHRDKTRASGFLDIELPGSEAPDAYDYDPHDPVPTHGGRILATVMGPVNQAAIETRSDVLVYTTPPLAEDLEVTGPISVVLYAQSSAPDTDFTAKLVDVWPTGEAYILADGIVRARYRDTERSPTPIDREKIYRYSIDLLATSNVFEAGHSVRLEISSSNFPKYDRNLNTGQGIGDSAKIQIAHQQIFHDGLRPSHVLLPIIPH